VEFFVGSAPPGEVAASTDVGDEAKAVIQVIQPLAPHVRGCVCSLCVRLCCRLAGGDSGGATASCSLHARVCSLCVCGCCAALAAPFAMNMASR